MPDCFVLLDDCKASAGHPSSRLYTGFVKAHVCADPGALVALWPSIQADIASGLHAAVLADYEWGSALPVPGNSRLSILLFRDLAFLSEAQVTHWLARMDDAESATPAGVAGWTASVSRAQFNTAIAAIHARVAAGETYQVNYTYRLHGQQYGTPLGLYRRLRDRQAVPFGALIALPSSPHLNALSDLPEESRWVLSCSPELFIRHDAGQLLARPMKGTAARGDSPEQDQKNAQWLANDPKNRAENVMIVDLLRNDLGRISAVGSVKVPALFAIESYRTAHQMTSTITSVLAPGMDFAKVLAALHPCGSITGAPKLNTMKLIAGLESTPRGLYTGAIGWLDAPQADQSCGNFCLSVAIRTLTLGNEQQGLRPATLGVGGGIVMDSTADSEYAESRLKASFLTGLDPGFTLFETLRLQGGRLARLDLHLARLASSAKLLGFRFNEAEVRAQLAHYLTHTSAQHPPDTSCRLRLDLAHDGSVQIAHSVLAPLAPGPVKLVLSASRVPAFELALLAHKTSLRSGYDQAIRHATAHGAFDEIFVNDRQEITEGARSNLFVQLEGKWWTPPLTCGLLPGVMRGRLLSRWPALGQRALTLPDLQQAQALAICSSLRGLVRAELSED
ncbi:MAG: chorismate-binding protein [Rhodoferax sp.]|nr:chorismate-binding protein [Rhodoferax sp.]